MLWVEQSVKDRRTSCYGPLNKVGLGLIEEKI